MALGMVVTHPTHSSTAAANTKLNHTFYIPYFIYHTYKGIREVPKIITNLCMHVILILPQWKQKT